MEWETVSRGSFDFDGMCNAIKKYIEEDKNYKYELIVGVDSQAHLIDRNYTTKFVTAVMIRRVGKGAQYYTKKEYTNNINSLKQKIYYEASLNLTTLDKLRSKLLNLIENYNLELQPHADLGLKGKTKELVKEIEGMFLSNGYPNVKIKPFSYCSSSVADKHSK